MSRLKNRRILLGLTGSIAAYKAAFLARELMREGAEVRIVMSSSAEEFVSPLTFSTLTGHAVLNKLSTEEGWSNHVKWGRWADLFVIAPATAQTLAKMARGMADNMLTACYLSSDCPVFVAPAMDVDMWHHPATGRNLELLKSDGVKVLHPESGPLASGLEGTGRMVEPLDITEKIVEYLGEKDSFYAGKSILITAGPTREDLDPVRFLSNGASGRTGIALAEEAARRGAHVSLVLGPTTLKPPANRVDVFPVRTAREMYDKCMELYSAQDISIFSAAVSDFRPAKQSDQKIKKSESTFTLKLEKNPDIAARLGEKKTSGQFNVGFALETEDEEEHALRKLREKNLDMIVLNKAGQQEVGMGSNRNKVRFLFPNNKSVSFELKLKEDIAIDILDTIKERIKSNE